MLLQTLLVPELLHMGLEFMTGHAAHVCLGFASLHGKGFGEVLLRAVFLTFQFIKIEYPRSCRYLLLFGLSPSALFLELAIHALQWMTLLLTNQLIHLFLFKNLGSIPRFWLLFSCFFGLSKTSLFIDDGRLGKRSFTIFEFYSFLF